MTMHLTARNLLVALAASLVLPIMAGTPAPALGAPPAGPAQKAPITHEKLWLLKRLSSPVVSPDGQWVVFTVLEPSYEPEKESSDLWLVAADGSSPARRLTYTKAPEGSVAWSPDSRRIAFTSKRDGDETEQLYVLDLAGGGEARRLTNLVSGVANPQWRPDGGAILFESTVYPGALDDEANRKEAAERKARKYNLRTYEHFPVRFWNQWLDDRQPSILVQSLVEGAAPRDILSGTRLARTAGFSGVQSESGNSLAPIWSPDGKEIVFTATTERWNAAFAHVGYRLYRLEAAGGEPREVTSTPGDYKGAMFSPDGRSLYFQFAPQDGQVYHLDRLQRISWPTGTAPVLVARDFDQDISGFAVGSDSRTIYLRSPQAGREGLYSVGAAGGRPSLLAGPPTGGYLSLCSAQKSPRPVLIATYGSSVSPPEVVRIEPARRTHVNLTHMDTAAAAGIDWRPPEHFYFTNAAGRTVHNMVIVPPAFDPARRYPLFVLIHGGAASFNPDQIGLRWNYHLLAAPGYVVLMTDYTGSSSFGEQFGQAIRLDPLKGPGADINQAVDEALRRYPFIDGQRMCAGGASYGGHLSNWLEATTTRYRCIVSHAGEVDLTTQWGESDSIYDRELTNDGPPWAGSPVWREQSPIAYGARWKTPILLSIGERDFRVPIGNTLENWAVLQRMQVPSRLLVWPDAGHWITKAEDSRRFYEEVAAWLAKYLKDDTSVH